MVNLETSDLRAAQDLREDLERKNSETFANILSGKTTAVAALSARERGIFVREAIAAVAD